METSIARDRLIPIMKDHLELEASNSLPWCFLNGDSV